MEQILIVSYNIVFTPNREKSSMSLRAIMSDVIAKMPHATLVRRNAIAISASFYSEECVGHFRKLCDVEVNPVHKRIEEEPEEKHGKTFTLIERFAKSRAGVISPILFDIVSISIGGGFIWLGCYPFESGISRDNPFLFLAGSLLAIYWFAGGLFLGAIFIWGGTYALIESLVLLLCRITTSLKRRLGR